MKVLMTYQNVNFPIQNKLPPLQDLMEYQKVMKKHNIEGVQTLNQWWEKWSSVTHNMQFSSKLVLTHNENESEELKKYLET